MTPKETWWPGRADVAGRIVRYETQNSMSIGNLAIVFGPTLFPPTAPHGANGQDGLVGATIQNKVRQFAHPESVGFSYLSRRLRPFSNTTPTYSSTSLKTHELRFFRRYLKGPVPTSLFWSHITSVYPSLPCRCTTAGVGIAVSCNLPLASIGLAVAIGIYAMCSETGRLLTR